jgi:hypothetical protein
MRRHSYTDEILNEDGELDGESDADDDDVGDDHDVEWMDGVSDGVSSSRYGEGSDRSSRGASPVSEAVRIDPVSLFNTNPLTPEPYRVT